MYRISKGISGILNRIGPGYASIYGKHLSDSTNQVKTMPTVKFTPIKIMPEDSLEWIEGLKKSLKSESNDNVIDLSKEFVLRPEIEDIELNGHEKMGQIILASKEELTVKYGNIGIAASAEKNAHDLLDKQIIIPSGSFGVLDIKKHTPFLIEHKENNLSFALGICKMERVPNHQENISKYILKTVVPLTIDDAKRLNLEIERTIFHDYSKESFFEEGVASKVYPPTCYNRSSGTLMSFESDTRHNKTTPMHYQIGERILHIFTTKKPAGVTLNFCGIHENPNDRKDCEVNLQFPPNSIVTLCFPSYTHHKFHGYFAAMIIHPREGDNLIKAVQSGKLLGKFLESATVFSSTKENQEKWQLSAPKKDSKEPEMSR